MATHATNTAGTTRPDSGESPIVSIVVSILLAAAAAGIAWLW